MAQNTSNHPSFSPAQRQQLTRLGLQDVEINELEIYLPCCRAILSPTAKLQDVRDEIESLRRKMERAHSAMSKLRNATPLMKAKYEALAWLISADEGGDVERAMQALESACGVVQRAQESLPTEQRRHRGAAIAPVRIIDDALLSGFIKRHSTRSEEGRWNPLPPYTLKRSSSPKSRYREIVGICYTAMEQRNPNPTRAIKEFIAWRKRTDEAGRLAYRVAEEQGRASSVESAVAWKSFMDGTAGGQET